MHCAAYLHELANRCNNLYQLAWIWFVVKAYSHMSYQIKVTVKRPPWHDELEHSTASKHGQSYRMSISF